MLWQALTHPLKTIAQVTRATALATMMAASDSPNQHTVLPWILEGIAVPVFAVSTATGATAAWIDDKASKAKAWLYKTGEGWKKVAEEDTAAFIAAAKRMAKEAENKGHTWGDWFNDKFRHAQSFARSEWNWLTGAEQPQQQQQNAPNTATPTPSQH